MSGNPFEVRVFSAAHRRLRGLRVPIADDLRQAALEYHPPADARQNRDRRDQAACQQRDLALAYSPAFAAARSPSSPIPRTPRILPSRRSRRGHHQRHGRPRPRRDRPLGRQTGDGRQGGPVQEVRRHRCLRYRDRCQGPDKLVDIIAALEPTFGAINLEDIKAPECFHVEAQAPRADEDSGLP